MWQFLSAGVFWGPLGALVGILLKHRLDVRKERREQLRIHQAEILDQLLDAFKSLAGMEPCPTWENNREEWMRRHASLCDEIESRRLQVVDEGLRDRLVAYRLSAAAEPTAGEQGMLLLLADALDTDEREIRRELLQDVIAVASSVRRGGAASVVTAKALGFHSAYAIYSARFAELQIEIMKDELRGRPFETWGAVDLHSEPVLRRLMERAYAEHGSWLTEFRPHEMPLRRLAIELLVAADAADADSGSGERSRGRWRLRRRS